MRLRRIAFRPHAPLWIQRWLYAELVAKGARVEIAPDGAWMVTW